MSLPVGLPVALSRRALNAWRHEQGSPNWLMTIAPNRSAK